MGTVLYRKWRPQRFADIVGQDPIVRTLKNAVAQDRVSHAYLFAGPRGTGKTSMGRILAKAINCPLDADGEPILDSEEALAIEEGRALDLVEIDAASNRGIDNIRDLRERANYVPTSSRFKVYLVDEVHQLTDAAADALLKTLEEPPPHVVFILATTDPEALKATVLSRCQRFDFRRVSVTDMAARLRTIADAEGITIPAEGLELIAREATGSVRDAVNLLDQVWATQGDDVSFDGVVASLGLSSDHRSLQLAGAALKKDLKSGLGLIAAVQEDAVDLARFNRQVVQHLRHALLLQTNVQDSLSLSEPELEELGKLVDGVAPATTVAALKAFASADLRSDPYASLPLELALAGLVYEPEPVPVAAAPSRDTGGASGRRSAPRGGQRDGAPRARGQTNEGARRQPPPRRQPRPSAPAASGAPAGTDAPSKPASPPRELSPEETVLLKLQAELKQRGEHKLTAYLNRSCVYSVDGDVVTLAFHPFAVDFHKSKVEEQLDVVTAALSEVLGRAVSVRCTAFEGATTASNGLVAEAERMGAKVVSPRSE